MKLEANVRFINLFNNNNIHDVGDKFEAKTKEEYDYLVQHKVAKPIKEAKAEEKPKSDKKK